MGDGCRALLPDLGESIAPSDLRYPIQQPELKKPCDKAVDGKANQYRALVGNGLVVVVEDVRAQMGLRNPGKISQAFFRRYQRWVDTSVPAPGRSPG